MLSLIRSRVVPIASIAFVSAAFITLFSVQYGIGNAVHSECSDGLDNDGNGKYDYPQDPQCETMDDDHEGVSTRGTFVTVTDGKDKIGAGGAVVYRITLKQQRETARNVDITLHLPHQSNITSASDAGEYAVDTVRWKNVSIYKNVTRVITVNVNISPDARAGEYLVARVLVDGAEATDTTLVDANVIESQAYAYRLSVTDGKTDILPGTDNTYTVRVRNVSSATRTEDVRLALPNDTFFVGASDAGQYKSYDVTWKKITLAPNEERTFKATIRIDNRVNNHMILRARAFIGVAQAIDQTVVNLGVPQGAITANISDDRSESSIGQVLHYRVVVRNDSDVVATNVSVDASLPLYGEFVDATEGGTWDGSNVRWLILTVAPRDTRTLTYSVRVRSDAPLGAVLVASVSADGQMTRDRTGVGVATAGDNIASAERTLFRKTADRSEAVPGGIIRYTLFVRNTLNHAISDATILDRFDPQYLSLRSAEQREFLSSLDGNEMLWQVPVLQPGESWTTSYVLAVSPNAPQAMVLDNVAVLRGTGLEGVSLNERVRTNSSGVIREFPTTGVGTDAVLALVLAMIAVGAAMTQRKLAYGSI